MIYDVSPEVLAEDARIRRLQEQRDREREQQDLRKAEQKAEWEAMVAEARSLGMWNDQEHCIRIQTVTRALAKIDKEKAALDASKHWDRIMQVYADGLDSDDERHQLACANALKGMIIGKDPTAPPPEDSNKKRAMIAGSVDEVMDMMGIADDDEEDDG